MVIQHNMASANANRQLGISGNALGKISEKLSSGYRINRAADDAAGLSISEKMRSQIRGLNRASDNAKEGIAFIQTAEGALGEMHSMLQRCRELAVQAANDTNTAEDRAAVQSELDELTKEIDRIASTTQYNTIHTFSGYDNLTNNPAGSANGIANTTYEIEWAFVDNNGNKVPAVDQSQAVGNITNYPANGLAQFVQHAAASAVANLKTIYSGLFSNASSANIQVGLNLAPMDGPGKTLASAALSMSATSSYTVMSYTLNVDTSDYGIQTFNSMTDAQKADLAATIAHEMTHLVMYDTLTDGMLPNKSTSFPSWFVEGMAQTASGDGSWVSITTSSTDAQIQSYMSELQTKPYGAGYVGVLCLGQMVNGGSTVSSATIRNGLNTLLSDMATGKTLDQAIKDHTSYAGMADFENKFKNAASGSAELQFVKDLLAVTGNGAGSLFGALSDSETQIFAPGVVGNATLSPNYAVNTDNTRYANEFGSGYNFPPASTGGGGGGTGTLPGDGGLHIQVGALANQYVLIPRYDVSSTSLFGGANLLVYDFDSAGTTMETLDLAIEKVSSVRSTYGALQNRLEHTIANLDNTSENTQAAESRIRDADMAKCMVAFSSYNILQQAGQAMLAQTMQQPQRVVELLTE